MKIKRQDLTQSMVKRVLRYDPYSGIFTWRVYRSHNANKGDRAGTKKPDSSYRQIALFGVIYLEHRLAVFYMTGKWPAIQVDHEHGVRDDNRWHKLRDATPSENGQNRHRADRDSTTGLLGVYYRKKQGDYVAQLVLNGKKVYVQRFDDKYEAYFAYLMAKVAQHPHQTIVRKHEHKQRRTDPVCSSTRAR